ncbi:uncharacterized protein LOC122499782 [Leptopilina heterotoma]|uniref:uncharacterized protein LOC122499782 n=1 Tax=Leptopilina heterotoma TaxID=63436 RepID=UPI001CA9E28F|nr:uncharacterized protein LOC122499782 [Leptopilina heterotoma]
MSDLILTCKPFQLVHFTSSGKSRITRTVDITLLKWINFDNKKKQFLTKYMPPPYNEETNKLLYDLIQNNEDALDRNWPEYVVKIVGHADTYEQAVMGLNELKIKEFAYTETEVNPEKRAKLAASKIKQQLMSLPDLNSIMNVSTIGEPQPGISGVKSKNVSNSKQYRNSTTFSDKTAVYYDSQNSDNSLSKVSSKRNKAKKNSNAQRNNIVSQTSDVNRLKNNIVDSDSSENHDPVPKKRRRKMLKNNSKTQRNPTREYSDEDVSTEDLHGKTFEKSAFPLSQNFASHCMESLIARHWVRSITVFDRQTSQKV